VRFREMQEVARTLDLSSMEVLGFPDGQLQEFDPRMLEDAVAAVIATTRPDVLVTYPIHGISGHPDHLVIHGIVKRVFCALQGQAGAARRLAFFTLRREGRPDRLPHLKGSPDEAIDCIVRFDEEDRARAAQALD